MKTIKTAITLASAMLLAGALISCERADYPDRFRATKGVPTIYSIRYAQTGVYTDMAYMDEVLCLLGENLRSINQVFFNDQKAVLNTSFITNNTLVLSVPKSMPTVETDKIYCITAAKDTVEYDFRVLAPSPRVTEMSLEMTKPGEIVSIYGDYFYEKPGADIQVSFPNAEVPHSDIEIVSLNEIKVKIPAAAKAGKVKVTTLSGVGQSAFNYLDDRGLIFDFDGKTGLGNHGWHNMAITTDANALAGNYLMLGDGEAELSNWNDGKYSFEYWAGSWDDKQNIASGDGIAIYNLVDCSNYSNMCLKFEMKVPSSSPWTDFTMQIAFAGVDKVTISGNPIDGEDKVAGANQWLFNGEGGDGQEKFGRAHYALWKTGRTHTDDKWITVTIPISSFNLDTNGAAAETGFTSFKDFASLDIFVRTPQAGSDPCKAVIMIDNIRLVPVK